MKHESNATILIPCAGYGNRVGRPPAKELLTDPTTTRPLIERALQTALQIGAHAHVITRKEKTSLIEWLNEFSQTHPINLSIQWVEPTPEWPHTLLLSQDYWSDKNLVLLPDTRWQPENSPEVLFQQLNENELAYGVFKVPSLSTWGAVRFCSNQEIEIVEKPPFENKNFWAWGLLAFQKNKGTESLQAHAKSALSHKVIKLRSKTALISLDSFMDLTRTGQGEFPPGDRSAYP